MAFRRRLRETRQIVRVNGRSIVLFEAAYRLLALPLLLRMADALMRFSLHASGYSYVTVNNLVSFLGEPAAIASLCMEVAVLLLCAALEAGCLVTAFQAAAESRRLSVLAIFQGGLSHGCDVRALGMADSCLRGGAVHCHSGSHGFCRVWLYGGAALL